MDLVWKSLVMYVELGHGLMLSGEVHSGFVGWSSVRMDVARYCAISCCEVR